MTLKLEEIVLETDGAVSEQVLQWDTFFLNFVPYCSALVTPFLFLFQF